MARHRAAGRRPSFPGIVSGRTREQSLRRAARSAGREAARRQARAERAHRRARTRTRRSRRVRVPLGQRLLALPWVTFVLLALVAGAVVGVLRPEAFAARSTVTATTPQAAAQAAVALTRPGLVGQVEEQMELDPGWRRSVRLEVERPDAGPTVVVRATAPDPRLAALAADTAAATVVEEREELSLSEVAVVPTLPLDRDSWWWWALGGAAVLAVAIAVERRHDRRERAEEEQAAAVAVAGGTVPGPTAAPVAVPGMSATSAPPVTSGGAR